MSGDHAPCELILFQDGDIGLTRWATEDPFLMPAGPPQKDLHLAPRDEEPVEPRAHAAVIADTQPDLSGEDPSSPVPKVVAPIECRRSAAVRIGAPRQDPGTGRCVVGPLGEYAPQALRRSEDAEVVSEKHDGVESGDSGREIIERQVPGLAYTPASG